MKSYVTSGTGSQQTLTGSQDEKVAVYQTLADAEADLANLEAGQIVATPDTGDEDAQPVNVVESGNMHAVTSNAVAESLSYSTTEQKTGGVWTDGKPIYRKVVDFGALPNNSTKSVAHNISNIDNVMSISIIAKSSSEFLILSTGKNGVTDFNAWVTLTHVNIHTDSDRTNYNAYATVEYTKTTD